MASAGVGFEWHRSISISLIRVGEAGEGPGQSRGEMRRGNKDVRGSSQRCCFRKPPVHPAHPKRPWGQQRSRPETMSHTVGDTVGGDCSRGRPREGVPHPRRCPLRREGPPQGGETWEPTWMRPVSKTTELQETILSSACYHGNTTIRVDIALSFCVKPLSRRNMIWN